MKFLTSLTAITLSLAYISGVKAGPWPTNLPNPEGNCVSGSFPFNKDRIQNIAPAYGMPKDFNYDAYDYVILEGPDNISFDGGVAKLDLVRPPDNKTAYVTKLGWSRWMKYGSYSIKMKAPRHPGLISAIVAMSNVGDEIDWEVVGANPDHIDTVTFYRGIEEYGVHGETHPVNKTDEFHTYTVEWTDSFIRYLIDGVEVRKTTPEIETAKSTMTPSGEQWFPTTASTIAFSLWQKDSDWSGFVEWDKYQGDKFTVEFKDFVVQCYDDSMKPVDSYPKAVDPPKTTSTSQSSSSTQATSSSKSSTSNTSSVSTTSSSTSNSQTKSTSSLNEPTTSSSSKATSSTSKSTTSTKASDTKTQVSTSTNTSTKTNVTTSNGSTITSKSTVTSKTTATPTRLDESPIEVNSGIARLAYAPVLLYGAGLLAIVNYFN